MKKQNKEIEKIKEKIIPILKRNGVKRAGIFGSYARGEQTKDSDVDVLVEITGRKISLLDIIKLQFVLERELNKKVDILEYIEINNLLRRIILNEEVRII